ncbi:hypothetical protein [Alienimonas chondri]|uniref:Uncharacterized protein n=1 Tax=Alienimonas chondri TaxID=2681879 RepID=A0ABX1VDD7_9PLAN|nr:hypothetical protein [Alienimonas chondri]NNJ25912.1 hypothetical protein [Alienimonas chondri]
MTASVTTTTAAATLGLPGRRETRVGWGEPDAAAVVLLAAAGFGLVYAVS